MRKENGEGHIYREQQSGFDNMEETASTTASTVSEKGKMDGNGNETAAG